MSTATAALTPVAETFEAPPAPIVFTDSAAAKVAELVAEEGNPELTNEDDTPMHKNGVTLLIDAMSLQYLIGAEIDYKDDLEGAQFVIRNPNASTTCGCGSSFSV
jgi:iron-sulfur cluster insertion protein